MATPGSAISIPTTQYAKSYRYHIAYQVFGSGAFDLVIIPGFMSDVEMWWELPAGEPGGLGRGAGLANGTDTGGRLGNRVRGSRTTPLERRTR